MWLGHAQLSTTERYAHLAPLAGAELIDRLASSA
jgi:site-specific recombinase XerD